MPCPGRRFAVGLVTDQLSFYSNAFRGASVAAGLDEGALSFVTASLNLIGILHINENGGGRMTEGPRRRPSPGAGPTRPRRRSTTRCWCEGPRAARSTAPRCMLPSRLTDY